MCHMYLHLPNRKIAQMGRVFFEELEPELNINIKKLYLTPLGTTTYDQEVISSPL